MNKISSTGLNLVSKNVKENIEQTKSIQKEIINTQQDIINDSKFTCILCVGISILVCRI